MIGQINEKAEDVTIRHEYHSNLNGFTKIEVEAVFGFQYMAEKRDGSLQPRWSSRTYKPTPASLMRLIRYLTKANIVEQYVHGDDWYFTHETTFLRI